MPNLSPKHYPYIHLQSAKQIHTAVSQPNLVSSISFTLLDFVWFILFSKTKTMSAVRMQAGSARETRVPVRVSKKLETAASIPIIDLSGLNPHVKNRSLIIEDIRNVCQTNGSFQVINHGINKSVIEGAMEAALDFFALSQELKQQFASTDVHEPVRYGVCTTDDKATKPRDFLKQYAHPLQDWIGYWPHSHQYRKKMGQYAVEVRRVALQLMDAILESLGLGQDYIKEKLEEGMQVMTVNNYEKSSEIPDSKLGLAPHSDYGCITIILQSCGGLQVIDRSTNTWQAVPVESPDILHVHIGDYLEVLSNGRYKSVVHRVMLDCEKRMSIASIHGLAMDSVVTAAAQLVDDEHPKGYRDSSFRDFLSYISKNDFAKGSRFIDSLRVTKP